MMFILSVLVAVFGIVHSQNVKEVAFSAGVTHDHTYNSDDTIIYDRVFTNIGGGYDPATGYFTCPQGKSGIYLFQFHSLSHLDANTYLELYKNAYYVQSIFGHSVNDYAEAGNTVILQLTGGDVVQVKAVDPQYGYTTNIYGQPDEIYTTFTGYLIAAVDEDITPVGK